MKFLPTHLAGSNKTVYSIYNIQTIIHNCNSCRHAACVMRTVGLHLGYSSLWRLVKKTNSHTANAIHNCNGHHKSELTNTIGSLLERLNAVWTVLHPPKICIGPHLSDGGNLYSGVN